MCVFEPVQHPDTKDTSLTVSRLRCVSVTVWPWIYSDHPENEAFLFSGCLLFEIEQNIFSKNSSQSHQGSTSISFCLCTSSRFGLSVLNSPLLLKSRLVIRKGGVLYILNTTQYLFHCRSSQYSPVV